MIERKSIRLTSNSYAVLALFQHLGEASSYDLKQALERSIQNFWPVPHTTAYDEPARLAAAGYLSAHQEQTGRRRRVYAITAAGREALQAWANVPAAAPPQLRDEGLLKIFAGAEPEPILTAHDSWHRAKLAELETYLAAVQALDDELSDVSVERTLLAGVTYHRKMVELIEELSAARAQR